MHPAHIYWVKTNIAQLKTKGGCKYSCFLFYTQLDTLKHRKHRTVNPKQVQYVGIRTVCAKQLRWCTLVS
jgi:hypothetical protein